MARFKPHKSSLRTFKPKPREVKPGLHLLTIDALSDDGRGVSRVQGKTVFVAGALPGEEVKARYSASHKRFDEAEAVQVVVRSPMRIEPPCSYASECGGCSLQHLDYAQQLAHKQQQLNRQFSTLIANPDAEPPTAISAQSLHYRHRVKLAVQSTSRGFELGFRQSKSHQLVSIEHCKILYPSLSDQLPAIKSVLSSLRNRSSLSELSLCEDSDGRQGMLLLCKKALPDADLSQLTEYAEKHQLSIEVHLQGSNSQQPSWQTNACLFNFSLAEGPLSLAFTLCDFTQVNPQINQQLIRCATDWLQLQPADMLVDYFCGLGNFSLSMANQVSSVTAYEFSPSMVARASQNATDNGITNCHFLVENLIADKVAINASASKVILDPPRAGAEHLCRQLAQGSAERIVYISCNPHTLWRDAGLLTAENYQLETVRLADMFPQTSHSEVIALFTRLN